MVSSTTIFNTSAEAVADTNKTNPTNATDKRKILIKLAAVALSAPASRCGNVSALLSRKSNPNRSKTVWRGRPFDFAQGRLSPASGPSPFPTPSWQETPTASRCSGFSSHPIRTRLAGEQRKSAPYKRKYLFRIPTYQICTCARKAKVLAGAAPHPALSRLLLQQSQPDSPAPYKSHISDFDPGSLALRDFEPVLK